MAVKNEISKAFSKHAEEYERAAKVQQEIGERLFERLHYLKIAPQRILDLGCGPGSFSRELSLFYPKAQIIGLDLVPGMLALARKKQTWRRKWSLVAADMQHMPFATGMFDLVFTNQVIHWANPMAQVFREINRVMNVNGCLMFTTLGPDTFKELKMAWSGANHYAHVNEFSDMHDIGDSLMAEHFLDPVMDMELLSVHYETLPKLISALRAQGVRNINPERNHGLTGRTAWQQFEKNYSGLIADNGKYPLTYEVVYGHAWKGEQRKTDKGIETIIPVSQIRINKA
ncbi:malonyl-ACP O-methyltransferase BioC [Legionella bononiensis]|uniref:Malonyl-[acyl-carrier protein] O-methyltransferase n=1 Tax=Legionella bononiensis TaxID=2793102 RepID=A0ABS1WAY7_9GAMM|nr:malonyl-ACP O-methyltransferase BioC [Legionella bononiensis]MBL7480246.1 malonyl-ACP O-methyltransferase BioC [Legionella bononiensis]MBL7526522.1 malonyl-ACP O-methyltransferase BioC [Legionella bononiensis]MBL7562984.1 malonyl-ACP O-methyltransferase BioC [Legionella bononiensis]